jgi:predicted nucleic acid-binding protein
MVFSAVLDANVLYPFSLRDLLLRLAELELYAPLWSERILDEMRRNLIERYTEEQADAIMAAMRGAFEEAEVDAAEVERLEPAMTNDAKDRHVLATAVAADCELIVTFDVDDFPVEACEPVGVEALDPDSFLLDLRDLSPEGVLITLRRLADHLRKPKPWTLEELLGALNTAGVPRFVAAVRADLADRVDIRS